jgi:hypothetical protein
MKRKPPMHYTRTAALYAIAMCGSDNPHTLVMADVTCRSCLHLAGKCDPVTCKNRACQSKRIKAHGHAQRNLAALH